MRLSGESKATRIFASRRILTMNPSRPEATHVAVRDGRILGVGSLDELAGWGAYELDESLQDKVIFPGFVEGHSHSMEGTVWNHTYVGFHPRRAPGQRIPPGWPPCPAWAPRISSYSPQPSIWAR